MINIERMNYFLKNFTQGRVKLYMSCQIIDLTKETPLMVIYDLDLPQMTNEVLRIKSSLNHYFTVVFPAPIDNLEKYYHYIYVPDCSDSFLNENVLKEFYLDALEKFEKAIFTPEGYIRPEWFGWEDREVKEDDASHIDMYPYSWASPVNVLPLKRVNYQKTLKRPLSGEYGKFAWDQEIDYCEYHKDGKAIGAIRRNPYLNTLCIYINIRDSKLDNYIMKDVISDNDFFVDSLKDKDLEVTFRNDIRSGNWIGFDFAHCWNVFPSDPFNGPIGLNGNRYYITWEEAEKKLLKVYNFITRGDER